MGRNEKLISKSRILGVDLLMILVTLGTQDKPFPRLIEAVEKQIKLGNIKEEVIVQSGSTKYQSELLKVFDYIPIDEFNNLIEQASLIITHAGVRYHYKWAKE
jgi:UDP-N-acetylglucosamine transferase subunit ALG13